MAPLSPPRPPLLSTPSLTTTGTRGQGAPCTTAVKVGSWAHGSGDTLWAVGPAEQTENVQHWKQRRVEVGHTRAWARGLPAPVEQKPGWGGGGPQPGDRVCLTGVQQGRSGGSTGTSVEQGGQREALTAEGRGGQGAQRSPR